LSSKYQYVVIDNEAGMEHLSRRTTNNVDLLCLVSEATSVGALTARRIHELARQLPIVVRKIGVLWNKTECDYPQADAAETLEVLACVPEDAAVLEASRRGTDVCPAGRQFRVPDGAGDGGASPEWRIEEG
jgi:CO dehydrogenase maturation factor